MGPIADRDRKQQNVRRNTMKMKNLLTTIAISLSCACVVQAQIQEGTREFNVMGSLSKMDVEDSEMTMIMAVGTFNKFVADNMSMGVSFMGTWQEMTTESDDYYYEDDDSSSESTMLFIMGRGDYYFPGESEIVPYVGGRLGLVSVDTGGDSESGLIYGPHAGIKRFLNESTSVNFELQYSKYEIADADVDQLNFLIGISVYY
jgi:opacity protein-like surface antigen